MKILFAFSWECLVPGDFALGGCHVDATLMGWLKDISSLLFSVIRTGY
jgi:hypothetical protein